MTVAMRTATVMATVPSSPRRRSSAQSPIAAIATATHITAGAKRANARRNGATSKNSDAGISIEAPNHRVGDARLSQTSTRPSGAPMPAASRARGAEPWSVA